MPSTDIPIELINLALLAIISLPVVLLGSVVWAANRIVRPMWAIRDKLAHIQSEGLPQRPVHNPDPVAEKVGEVQRHVAYSMFGR